MARACVATAVALLILGVAGNARGQPCACGGASAPRLLPTEPDPSSGASPQELEALLASGAAVSITSYVLGTVLARDQVNRNVVLDGTPIVGALGSAVRNGSNQRDASLLAFFGAAQAMGLLVVVAAATDLAAQRNLVIDVDAGPNGCSASLTWRIP